MTAHTVLVDLDGTVTDPADGIIGGFQHALRKLGAAVPHRDDLKWVIGPPLRQAFPRLLDTPEPERVEAAVAAYREYYGTTGIFEATVYEGIPSALETMRSAGYRLLLCTAKPHVFASPILDHFDLDHLFDAVFGAELDGRFDDKGELIARILREQNVDPAATVMIGDRGSDMSAAARNGVAGVGVVWGYGSPQELDAAGARLLCTSPAELMTAATSLLARSRTA
jgi:phosphoglycolate phosphatase